MSAREVREVRHCRKCHVEGAWWVADAGEYLCRRHEQDFQVWQAVHPDEPVVEYVEPSLARLDRELAAQAAERLPDAAVSQLRHSSQAGLGTFPRGVR